MKKSIFLFLAISILGSAIFAQSGKDNKAVVNENSNKSQTEQKNENNAELIHAVNIISEIFQEHKTKEVLSARELYKQTLKSIGKNEMPNNTILEIADEVIAKRPGANKATADGQFKQRSYDIVLAVLGLLENNNPTTNQNDYHCTMSLIALRSALRDHQTALQTYMDCRNNFNNSTGLGSGQLQSLADDLHLGKGELSESSNCSWFANRVNDSITKLKEAVSQVKENCK